MVELEAEWASRQAEADTRREAVEELRAARKEELLEGQMPSSPLKYVPPGPGQRDPWKDDAHHEQAQQNEANAWADTEMKRAQEQAALQEKAAQQKAYQFYRAQEVAAQSKTTQPLKKKRWWVPSFSEREAKRLVRAIPSIGIGSNRIPVPFLKILAPGKMISFGTVTAWDIASNANPNAELRVDGYGAGGAGDPMKPQTFAKVNVDERELESTIRIPSGLRLTESGFEASHGYSVYTRAKWDGWNTVASVDVYYADVDASGAGLKGNISSGVYVEVKPLQVATTVVVIALTIATFYFLGQPIQQPCFAGAC